MRCPSAGPTGRYTRTVASVARASLLVLDGFLLTPASVEACRDLLVQASQRLALKDPSLCKRQPEATWGTS